MKDFNKKIQDQFDRMMSLGKLFRVGLSGSAIWELYLKSFKDSPKFRDPASNVHNCNTCHNFIRRYGNIVAIDKDNTIVTIFDVELDESDEMKPVAEALNKAIRSSAITDVFFETFDELNSLPYEKVTKNNKTFQLGVRKNVKQYTKLNY